MTLQTGDPEFEHVLRVEVGGWTPDRGPDAHDLMVRESDDRADFRPGMPY